MIPPQIQKLLDTLHAESLTQERDISSEQMKSLYAQHASDPEGTIKQVDAIMQDKFIAIDQDKAMFIHSLLLAKGANIVVEAGTSFGVSTVYWALAVGQNAARTGAVGKVIATEKEASKAARARQLWKQCGSEVENIIELNEGDLQETLHGDLGLREDEHVDVLFLDIWPYVALPAFNLVAPKFKPGSVVIADNTVSSAKEYKELLAILRNPNGPWTTITLPFKGGLEMSVYTP